MSPVKFNLLILVNQCSRDFMNIFGSCRAYCVNNKLFILVVCSLIKIENALLWVIFIQRANKDKTAYITNRKK